MEVVNSNNSESICNSFGSSISNKEKTELVKMNMDSFDSTERKSDDEVADVSILKTLIR